MPGAPVLHAPGQPEQKQIHVKHLFIVDVVLRKRPHEQHHGYSDQSGRVEVGRTVVRKRSHRANEHDKYHDPERCERNESHESACRQDLQANVVCVHRGQNAAISVLPHKAIGLDRVVSHSDPEYGVLDEQIPRHTPEHETCVHIAVGRRMYDGRGGKRTS